MFTPTGNVQNPPCTNFVKVIGGGYESHSAIVLVRFAKRANPKNVGDEKKYS